MEELIKHYVDLLIIQYRTKMKAMATIEAFVKVVFADDSNEIFLNKIQNAYDLDTASLAQLNVLAKYIGYDDSLNLINNNYFRLSDTEGEDVTPGLSDTEGQYVGYPLLNYSGYTYTKVSLSGLTNVDFFRKVLKFLAEMKNEILSVGNIDRVLYKIFGEDISVEEGAKSITYIYSEAILDLFDGNVENIETFIKKFFPRPMGCSLFVRQEYYYINAIPHGGAENYVDGLIFTRDSGDYNVFFETPMKFNFKAMEYPVFHTLKVKARIKIIDEESIYSAGYWTTLNGNEYSNTNMQDLCLIKDVNVFSMITNSVRRDIISIGNYGNKWVDITLELNHAKYGTHTIWAIVECEGVETQTVNTMYSTPDWNNFPLLWGVAGSVSLYPSSLNGAIDFKGCSVEIDGEVKWKGYTNKRIQGV